MKVVFCDICGKEMTQASTGQLARGALMEIARAEHVCTACADAAAGIDWQETVREAWREARGEG